MTVFIRQRTKNDCGIACLSMLCAVTYEEAEKAIPWRSSSSIHGTDTKQLREGAMRLGYSTESTLQHRLKPVKAPKSWEGLLPPMVSDWWALIPDNSLVKIPHPKGPSWGWHWVAWRSGRVYDPAYGVVAPGKYGVKPLSYMEFKKIENPCPECGAETITKWSGIACSKCNYIFCY